VRIRIHRGTQQIGGTCIELEAQGRRIVLDLGLPLDQEDSPELLPPVAGFHGPVDSLLAVVISHPHMDHYGLVRHLPPAVPLAIGEAAARILNAAAQFILGAEPLHPAHTLKDHEPLQLGPFKITPYLVDHAAYDAYALLVEADGQRALYSGDFRGHGRKAALFERMLREPPQGIDVLLMEGTTLGREGTDIGYPSEQDLEREFVAACAETSGMLLALASAQNIDRVVTLFRACKRSGRVLIIDLYAAAVLAATGNERIPQSDWPEVRLFTPERQRRWVVRNELFDVLHTHKSRRIYRQHLAGLAPRAALLFRDSMTEDLERAACLDGARLIYSMWPGYLAEPRMQRLLKWVERHGIPLQHIHTSGHASAADLRRFAKALAPKRLVPIHTFHPERYGSLYHTIDPRQDGEWWDM
jgi:ribonuclease J